MPSVTRRTTRSAQVLGGMLGTAAALAILAVITGTIFWIIVIAGIRFMAAKRRSSS